MAGDGDLEVSPAAVKNIQDGLRKAIAELRESGMRPAPRRVPGSAICR